MLVNAAQVGEHVFACEAKDASTSAELVAALKRIESKLARTLGPVCGDAGFKAMFSRALRKNKVSFASLHGLMTPADATAHLEELWVRLEGQQATVLKPLAIGIVATLFELLATFVGDALASRMFDSIWPEATAPSQTGASVEK